MLSSSHGASSTFSNREIVDRVVAEERFQDSLSNDLRIYPTNIHARLILPSSLEQAPDAVNGMALTAFSLAGVAMDPDLLHRALVSFDSEHSQWKATWQKPPMFHFGMILLPSLLQKINIGQKLTFETKGELTTLYKDDSGHLLVQRGSHSEQLSANDLRDLLRSKIRSEGMTLFLDPLGNLVLEASGQRATALSNLNSQK